MNNRTVIWIAVGVLAVAALALALMPRGGSGTAGGAGGGTAGGAWPASRDISAAELKDFVSRGARLVDVRTAGEFAGGHIEGAQNVPIADITSAASGWDKKVPVVLYCQSGARSANAFSYLQSQGFQYVYNLPGGLASWDGPLVQGSASGAATGGTAKGPALGRPIMYDFASAT